MNGQLYDIWNLPEDQSVYREISEGKTETVFQFHPPSARRWLKYFDFERGNGRKGLASINDLSTFTALDRPGGLDSFVEDGRGGKHNMMVEYAHRLRGGKPNGDPELNAALYELVPETMGILCFQESLTRVYQILGGTTGAEADEFRVHISKKQMAKVEKDKAIFMRGAVERLGVSVSEKLWVNMDAWSRYGFNKSVATDTIITDVDGVSKPIVDFVPGNKVWCVDDYGQKVQTDVVAVHDHGELEAFEVEFDDGYKITCSAEHKFLTTEGMTPLRRIIEQGLEIYANQK
jgi:hypothetical protein